ncbi:VCBS domain-containing protein [Aeromonas rivipollensis]
MTGTNDGATISGDAVGAVSEDGNDPLLTDSGSLSVADVDQGEDVFDTGSVTDTTVGGALGSLSITAAGAWSYSVATADVQYLGAGDTRVETFEVSSNDGTATETVTVTITGTNDGATISGDAVGAVSEDGNDPLLTDSGSLSVADVDQGEDVFDTGSVTDTTVGGALGSLSITAAGTWTYEVANAAVQYLGAGDTRVETFEVSSVDGTATETVTVTITGTNDAPVLSIPTAASITDTAANDTYPDITGTLAASDVDLTDTLTYGISGGVAGSYFSGAYDVAKMDTYGTLYVHSESGDYRFVANDVAAEALTTGQNPTQNFTVTVTDDSGALNNIDTEILSLNVTGSNDAPVSTNNSVTTDEGTAILLSLSDFGSYADAEGSAIAAVKITTLESNGSLEFFNGSSWVGVTTDQEISAADISGGKLRFVPDGNENGSPYATVSFKVSDGAVFSTSEYALILNVTAVNDSPSIDFSPTTNSYNVRDEFSSTAYNNNDGSTNWASNWTENGEATNATAGDIRIVNVSGAMALQFGDSVGAIDNADDSIQRTVNLSGAESATLSFDYRRVDLDNAGDQVLVQVSSDNGANFTTVQTLAGAGNDASFLSSSIDISAYISATTVVRIVASAGLNSLTEGDFVYIDNVNVAYVISNTPTYTEGGAAVLLDSGAVLSDPELDAVNNYAGATLTLSRNGGASAYDVFSGSGLLSLSGGNVIYNGTNVGAYTQSGGTLAITFNGNATSAVADGVLQSLAYANTSNTPPASVQIHYVFSDGNSGAQGSGGALSAAGDVTVNIVAVNDAPVNSVSTSISVTEDTATKLTGISVSDTDIGGSNLTVTLSIPGSSGALSASSAGGVTIGGSATALTLTGTLTAINAFLTNPAQGVTYTPVANATADVTLTVTSSDGGATGAGGTLTDSDTITLDLIAVNDAPVLNAAATPTGTAVAEDAAAPVGAVGTLVSSLVDFNSPAAGNNNVSDADSSPVTGIAITAADAANGTWYYSLDGGANWLLLSTPTDGAARLLAVDANNRLYFRPNADYDGSANITFRAWDQTVGTDGGTADTTVNGGSTAYSTATDTAIFDVTAVNDAPIFAATGGLTVISNSGSGSVDFTEATLAAYFSDPEGAAIGINTVSATSGLDSASGTNLGNNTTTGTITIDDNNTLDGSFQISATDGLASSANVSITFDNNSTTTTTLSAAGSGDSIIVADQSSNTTLNGGAGADYLIGNSGDDTLVGAGNDKVLNGGNGTDTLQINAHFTSAGDGQIVSIENIQLMASGLTLDLSNQSEGFTISGSTGADNITGGTGGDRINGGSGDDTLTGGSGADQFRLQTNGGNDTIVDYVDDTDEIAFLDNGSSGSGSVNFGNTGGSVNGNTLDGDDFDVRTSFAAIQNSDDNQVVRVSAAGITSANILAADAGDDATNTYVIVFNDELDRGEIWFDTNWNDTANRVQVATLSNITTLAQLNAIDANDIDVYSSPVVAPAGIAGEPINLALTAPEEHVGDITLSISGVPTGWSISGGTDNGDGSWTVVTDDPSSLTVTTAADFAGAMVLPVSMRWTNADGSEGHTTLLDNVEAYAPGSPIFALSQDDNLSGSSGADTFVFAQPIAHNQVYGFDVAADRLDLIGFGAGLDFTSLQIADDGQGNAVITLGPDSSITLRGVDAGALGAANFVFDLAPEMSNSGTMILHDGAMLPLGGFLDNSGSVLLDSHGQTTRLEVLVEHLTLRGGGQVVLSDSPTNLIVGSTPQSRLVNENNTISGAGQLGGGQLMLANAGLILANGLHALLLDTGNNVIDNSGTLAATGAGGMTVASALDNSGHLWANGGDLRLLGDVTGGGSATIDGDGTLAFGGAARLGSVAFHGDGAGTLAVEADDAMSLGTILGLEQEDGLLLSDLVFGADTRLSYSASADGTGGLLTVSDGTQSAALRLLGHYSEGDFLLAGEADGSVKVGYGGAASGTLVGTMADDDLQGGAGNDILVGRAGSDLLHGGSGADTFAWLQGDLEAGKVTLDYVADFNQGEGDRLDLSDLLDQDGSQTMDSLKSLLSMVQETDGIHLQVQDTTTHQVAQGIVLMNHSFGSLTGDASSTASQVIDYLLSNHRLDIDNP